MLSPAKPKLRLNRPAFFKSLGYTPHAGQQSVHDSKALRRVVACGVRWGKSVAATMEGLAAAMEPRERSMGWVVAPTYELADKVFREMVILTAEHLRHRIITMREHDRMLKLRNLSGGVSEIRGKTADNPVSLLGEGLDWLIVDEAARLKPMIWEAYLSQRLLDKQGWSLKISTPKGKGWFYDEYRRGQSHDPGYESWSAPSWENPYLSRDAIERERKRLPERVFRQEYGAEFLEGAGSVFRNVRDCATGTFHEPEDGKLYFGGLDLAKVEDYTVLVILDRAGRVVFADRFHRIDWAVQVSRIKVALERYNGASVLCDATGIGDPVLESMRLAGIPAMGYPLTSASKTAIINNLALTLEQMGLELPAPELWPEGIDELEAFQYSISDLGTVRQGAPAGYHDDCVIALALAAWQIRDAQPRIPPSVVVPPKGEPEMGSEEWERRWLFS